MDFWNAQSLFMRFFPLVTPDDKPKGIFVSIILMCFFLKSEMIVRELGFNFVVKISPPCDSNFEYADWYCLVGFCDLAIQLNLHYKHVLYSVINIKYNYVYSKWFCIVLLQFKFGFCSLHCCRNSALTFASYKCFNCILNCFLF